jgi:2'-5' RNA ligase
MPDTDRIYFIAIIPPEPIRSDITAFKQDMADRFHSKAALKIIPHITLKAPFKLPAHENGSVIAWFQQLPIRQSAFQIALKDFGAFDKRHPVLFIEPVLSPALQSLQKAITGNFKKQFPGVGLAANEKKFNPHITIAYRDLSPAAFRHAWQEYGEKHYKASFETDRFHLLQHDGQKWTTVEEHILGS